MTSNGQPPGSQPPHSFTLYFKEGGVGTFLPLYYSFLGAARGQVSHAAPQALCFVHVCAARC